MTIDTVSAAEFSRETPHDLGDVHEMLAELSRLDRESLKARVNSIRYYEIEVSHEGYSSELTSSGQGQCIDAIFAKEIADFASQRMDVYLAAARNEVRRINAAMEEIYSSPLYEEAVEEGLAPKLD